MHTRRVVLLLAACLAVLLPSCQKPQPAPAPPDPPAATRPPATRPASDPVPYVSFCGLRQPAHHVCYVIDRSGSMIDMFDAARNEMLLSISRLKPVQDFHVILFSEALPKELHHRRLVPATESYMRDAADFLEPIRAEGRTDPVPALLRAFEVLAKAEADPARPGKVIYLLTDGVFPDNKVVFDAIRQSNAKGEVVIHTVLLGNKPPEAVKVMKDIADQNGGKYRFVSADE